MDMWKFFDITHREHILCNPMSLEKLEQLIALLPLKPGARVLDIATGKGEFLIRLAERYRQITGTGIDCSPYCIADVRKKHQERGVIRGRTSKYQFSFICTLIDNSPWRLNRIV